MNTFFLILYRLGYYFWMGSLLSILIIFPLLQIYLDKEVTRKIAQKLIEKISLLIYLSGAIILLSSLFYQASQVSGRLELKSFLFIEINFITCTFILISSGLLLFLGKRVNISFGERVLNIDLLAKRLSNYHSTTIVILLIILAMGSFKLMNY